MSLSAAIRNDVVLQVRYGLYAVSLVMVLFWGALLVGASRNLSLSTAALLPALVVVNLLITTLYFMAALVLFEKAEGVLAALVVTPLGSSSYLFSKAISLTLLATVETFAIAAIVFKDIRWPSAIAGSLFLGFFYVCAGFIAVSPFSSINRFLMPSVLVVTFLLLPLLGHFELVPRSLMLLHPIEPSLRLMTGGGLPAAAAACGWCVAAFFLAKRAFDRFVVQA
jgi:fluoroquinolone transport system permease protein